jgi:hypothetical protein
MKIHTLPEVAEKGRISLRTLGRERQRGEGPREVSLSERRIGVTDDDFREWLKSRRKVRPVAKPVEGA